MIEPSESRSHMANRIPSSFLTDASALDETKHQKVKGQRGEISLVDHATTCASSRYRHNALANFICRGVEQSGTNRCGLATSITAHCAREVATFRRFRL